MKKGAKKISTARYVICIDSVSYPASLEMHKVYRSIPDKEAERDGDLRVIDESGEDYLYPAEYFIPLELPQAVVRAMKRTAA